MGMACSICNHSNKLEIDKMIVQGIAHLRIAKIYNLTDTAVRNHALNHMSRQILKSAEIRQRINANELFSEIETCLAEAKNIFFEAKETKKHSLQLQALREIRSTIEFLTRLAVDLSRLEQERELALMGTNNHQSVIIFPEINPSMSAEKASRLYDEFIKTLSLNPGKSVVLLPEEKNLDDEIQKQSTPMTRTKTKGSSADRVKADAQTPEDDDEQNKIDDILSWSPPTPERSTTWGSKRHRQGR
jgi:hypothetical protein